MAAACLFYPTCPSKCHRGRNNIDVHGYPEVHFVWPTRCPRRCAFRRERGTPHKKLEEVQKRHRQFDEVAMKAAWTPHKARQVWCVSCSIGHERKSFSVQIFDLQTLDSMTGRNFGGLSRVKRKSIMSTRMGFATPRLDWADFLRGQSRLTRSSANLLVSIIRWSNSGGRCHNPRTKG